jgi:hypothetical protein
MLVNIQRDDLNIIADSLGFYVNGAKQTANRLMDSNHRNAYNNLPASTEEIKGAKETADNIARVERQIIRMLEQ